MQKEEKGWWKRLLKSEEKPAPYIKVDWNKWCDEDDEGSNCKFIIQCSHEVYKHIVFFIYVLYMNPAQSCVFSEMLTW